MAPILGYWAIRGLAQPIRLLLAYTETEFEEKRYRSMLDWFQGDKLKLEMEFANLPYYIDGDFKITESTAILKYVARKNNLCGETNEEIARLEMLEGFIIDFRRGFLSLCFKSDFDTAKDEYKANVGKKLVLLDKFLGEKQFLAGDKLTYPDFLLYETIDIHKLFDMKIMEPYKNLLGFAERFEALPTIAAYMKSDKFIKRPLFSPAAKFNPK